MTQIFLPEMDARTSFLKHAVTERTTCLLSNLHVSIDAESLCLSLAAKHAVIAHYGENRIDRELGGGVGQANLEVLQSVGLELVPVTENDFSLLPLTRSGVMCREEIV